MMVGFSDNNFPPVAAFSFIADISYPSELCSSIFLSRCNLRCPFCINRNLVEGECAKTVDVEKLLARLVLRQEKTVVISGGEPFFHSNVENLFEAIKRAGMKVAVATNGSFPERMIAAVEENLIDHVIMDIKTVVDRDAYSRAVGRKLSDELFQKILESVDFLQHGPSYKPSCEFRTTVCTKFVSRKDLSSIVEFLGHDIIYVLQPFTTHQTLDPYLADSRYTVPFSTLEQWARELAEKVFLCFVREV